MIPTSGLLALFLYLAVARATTQLNLGVILPSSIVILVPFGVETFIRFLLYGQSGLPLENIISFSHIGLAVVQFIVALGLFWRLQHADDSIVEWLVLVVGGGLVLFFVLPILI
ncbi:hypothetical protein EON76_00035 [bacterium]|nr:MAG: hypothetical protein EON76_00035 [bacterium]